MGDVAAAVAQAGGSVARVFRNAELPIRLIEAPEQLILLRDQLALVEYAARELDDETLPLRLSMQGGVQILGAFGARVLAARTLRQAIEQCNLCIGSMLQTMTHMTLSREGAEAVWTYELLDGATVGRQKNELLAFGYMVETLRRFGVRNLSHATLASTPPARLRLQEMLGCEITWARGRRCVFPAACLDWSDAAPAAMDDADAAPIPPPDDFALTVEHLVGLAMLGRYPSLDYVCRRLSLPARTLQRRLASHQQSFEAIRRRVLLSRAEAYLADGAMPIIQIAYELGYSDPAHFTRAFVSWTGQTPRARRRALTESPAPPQRAPPSSLR